MQSGKEKIKKICDVIKNDTLIPAQKEAKNIIEEAKKEKERILEEANKEAERITQNAKQEMTKEKKVFESSLKLACKQTIDALKLQIEQEFFTKNLEQYVIENSADKNVIAQLIQVIVEAIQKEGADADISAYIPQKIPALEINKLLIKTVIDSLKEKEVLLGPFEGGIKIKLHDQQITIDISAEAIKELISNYTQKDFRDLIFSS